MLNRQVAKHRLGMIKGTRISKPGSKLSDKGTCFIVSMYQWNSSNSSKKSVTGRKGKQHWGFSYTELAELPEAGGEEKDLEASG